MNRLLLTVGLVGVALLATALPASACSCMQGDPRDQFNQADAAIVGEFVGQRPGSDEWNSIYTFNVQEEWKADFGETLDVHAASNGAACGIEAQVGQVVGLFLTMEGSGWHSSLCSQTSPSTMREAASPLPDPDGTGPVRMIVGGSFGEARVMSLDAQGRTLGYGYGGDYDVSMLDACPGGRHFVEIYEDQDDDGNYRRGFVVRRVDDLSVIRETELPFGQAKYVNALDCRTQDATETLMFVTSTYGRPNGEVYKATERGLRRTMGDLRARVAEFGDNHVYLAGSNHRLWSMRLDGGSARILYSIDDGQIGWPRLSPDGTHLAALVPGRYEPQRPAKLVLVELPEGKVRTKKVSEGVGYGGLLQWDGSRRFVAVGGGGSPVFNLRLDKVGGLGPAYMSAGAVIDQRLWGVSYGELLRADLPDGRFARDRILPSPVTYAFISIPG